MPDETESGGATRGNGVSVLSVLVAIIYGLAGIIAGLATHNFRVLFEGLIGTEPLPVFTQVVFSVPVMVWVGGSLVLGGGAGFLLESIHRVRGEVPRWVTMAAVLGAMIVLIAIMLVIAWPLFGRG